MVKMPYLARQIAPCFNFLNALPVSDESFCTSTGCFRSVASHEMHLNKYRLGCAAPTPHA